MTAYRWITRLAREIHGGIATEFALVVPVILAALGGIAGEAMALYTQNAMQDAVCVAARYATTYPTPSTASVIQKVRTGSVVDLSAASVNVASGTDSAGRSYFDVSATMTFTNNGLLLVGFNVPLQAKSRAYVG